MPRLNTLLSLAIDEQWKIDTTLASKLTKLEESFKKAPIVRGEDSSLVPECLPKLERLLQRNLDKRSL